MRRNNDGGGLYFTELDEADFLVDRDAFIVEGRSLKDDATGAADASEEKHPQEESIENHGDEFPVLHDLSVTNRLAQRAQFKRAFLTYLIVLVGILNVLSNESNSLQSQQQFRGEVPRQRVLRVGSVRLSVVSRVLVGLRVERVLVDGSHGLEPGAALQLRRVRLVHAAVRERLFGPGNGDDGVRTYP